MGLREQKKIKTRKAISDMATRLFVERGYHDVTTAEIAERAEVSVPTLFNYFPTKESLVFDEDTQTEAELVATVINRKKGVSIIEALLSAGLERINSLREEEREGFKAFTNLIDSTPELSLYSRQMWMRYEKSLAAAIRKEAKRKMSKLEAEAVSRFVLDSYHRAFGTPNPKAALRSLFEILSRGWTE